MEPARLWTGMLERVMHRDGQQLIPVPTQIAVASLLMFKKSKFALDIMKNNLTVSAA